MTPTGIASSRVLVLDDHKEQAERIAGLLRNGGFSNVETRSRLDNFLGLHGFDLVIADVMWPPEARSNLYSAEAGLDVMEYVLSNLPRTRVVLMSSATYDLSQVSRILKADGYFSLADSNPAIMRLIEGVMVRPSRHSGSAGGSAVISGNVFHGPVMITETNQGTIIGSVTGVSGEIIDRLNLLEKALTDGKDGTLSADVQEVDELRREIAQLRIELQKRNPNPGRLTAFLDRVRSIVPKLPAFAELVRELWALAQRLQGG